MSGEAAHDCKEKRSGRPVHEDEWSAHARVRKFAMGKDMFAHARHCVKVQRRVRFRSIE